MKTGSRKSLVLVTGGAGFIGSHLAEELLRRNYRVRVLDNLSQGSRGDVPESAEFIEGDITDPEACRAACQDVAGVFHLAAMSRVAPSLDNMESCTQTNVIGTQNVLIAARDAGVKKVVYSGSSTYYGKQPPPHVETAAPDFLNLYGLTKAAGEQYCLLFDRLYDLPSVVVRFFNVYGPRQPRVGTYALVLGIFLHQRRNNLPLEIHGSGAQRRDFVHVRDAVAAAIAAFEGAARGQAFNVGSGTNISVKELADLISSNQKFGPRRAGDAEDTLADLTRVRAGLGWEPKVSFEDGLRELMALEAAGVEELAMKAAR